MAVTLPQGWQPAPAWMPESIQQRVLDSWNQFYSPYNQARMADEGPSFQYGVGGLLGAFF